jgi:uncharacterized protein YdeI (YjbR/CyaY-like superfamily)
MTAPELPVKPFKTQAAFEAWLDKNHAKAPGIWIRLAKKSSGVKSITFPEALEVALCYGWIDGQSKGEDETYYRQRFVPRRARSTWSKINCAKAEELIAAKRMKPAGLAEVQRAKKDGRWEQAYDSPSNAKVPPDLAAALAKSKKAAAFFSKLDGQNRYAILFRIQTAKKPETRAKRIERFVQMCKDGEKIYP